MITEGEKAHGSYHIRMATDLDVDAIISLLKLSLSDKGVTRKTEAFWIWKHEDSPAGKSHVFVAEASESNMIIGLRVLMLWRARDASGSEITVVRPVDTATHPQWQRQGVFQNITMEAIDYLKKGTTAYIFNTPNEKSLPGYIKMGWKVAQKQDIYFRPTSLFRAIRNWRRPAGFQRSHLEEGSIEVLPVSDLRAEDFNMLLTYCEEVEDQRVQFGCRLRRDRETLRWRYSHPSAHYHVLVLREVPGTSKIDGVLFFRFDNRMKFRFALVTDYFTHSTKGYGRLIKAAVSKIDAAFIVLSSSEGTSEREVFSKIGFFAARRIIVAARPVDLEDKRVIAPSWDLTLADLEIF